MPTITFLQPGGESRDIDVDTGHTVMIGATMNAVPGINADCGGTLSCGTCHVYVDSTWADRVDEPADDELALLDGVAAERRETSRLSCQLVVADDLDGLVVTVPDRQF